MKEVLNTIAQKKLQSLFLSYILLVLPLLSPLAENLSTIDKLYIFGVCSILLISLIVLSTFISSRTERIIYSALLLISIVPGSTYLGYLLFAHVLLEQNSVTSLFETNPEESKEFVAHYMSIWVIVGVLIYTAIPIFIICKMRSIKRLQIRKHKAFFFIPLAIIIAIVSVSKLSHSVYFISFYRTFAEYKIQLNNEIHSIKDRQNQPFIVNITQPDSIPQTIVLVVAESLTRHHMSIYDYQRNTNPLLATYPDSTLFVYKDVVSPQVHTIPVMRSLFTMYDKEHPEYYIEKPSLYEIYNRAGFETYLLSNQGFNEECRTSYDVLLTLAQNKYDLSKQKKHDDVVFGKLDEILKTPSGKNRFIFIHLISNHMAYEFRYPAEFSKFDHKKDNLVESASYRDEAAKTMIDRYDNSVLYNDFIVDSIIKRLNKMENDNQALVYFSDHGEEVYDYREFAGHAYEKASPAMCEIPFLIWLSDGYKRKRNDLKFDISRPYSTQYLIHSLSDLSGLSYEGYDDAKSIFSSNYKTEERYIGAKKYNDLINAFGK